ncbi:MAG: hypothetical protein AAGJ82_13225 [Bacteroidota bacterium]
MQKIGLLLMGVLVLLFVRCTEEEGEPLNFFTVTTGEARPAEDAPLGTTILNGEVEPELGAGVPAVELSRRGFYWSPDFDALVAEDFSTVQELTPDDPDELDMQVTSPTMEAGVTYYYQAFAQSGDRLMKGEIRTTSFSPLLTMTYLGRENDSLRLLASVANLDGFVTDFGILLAAEHPVETVEDADWRISGLSTPTDQNTILEAKIGRVAFNTTYYATPYLRAEQYTYGDPIEIRVTDGWTRLANVPSGLEGMAGYSDGVQGWAFGGHREGQLAAFESSILYQFTPSAEDGPGEWIAADDVLIDWFNGQFLQLGEQFVYGLGNLTAGQPQRWYCYPENMTISTICDPSPGNDYVAADGVAFSIGDRLYFGTGRRHPFLGGGNSDQFWEMRFVAQQSCYQIRPVAALPISGTDGDMMEGGRNGAITFAIDGVHYVGGGTNDTLEFRDVYRFVPPQGDTDSGEWLLEGFLPGDPRSEATAFGLEGKGYYGFGFSLLSGSKKDFYRYDPDEQTWTPTEAFPGLPRSEAFSFVMGSMDRQRGFVGAGWQKTIPPNGNLIIPVHHNDFWTYTPAQ